MARILLVDDEPSVRQVLSIVLRGDGHSVHQAGGVAEALAVLAAETLDLVITDQKMRDGEGLEVLASCREMDAALPVVMLTAHASVELAVQAMRQGAFDFIPKPFTPEQVRAVVERACERTSLQRENRHLKEEVHRLGAGNELVGQSPLMQQVKQQIARVAPTNATVLITGETGSGKELAARAIHAGSGRAGKPFIVVNCAALPETLLESELFGHERGAFTGADRTRIGLFEAADGGTLFLDEIGEMPLPLQPKILRVLNDGQIMRLGARATRKTDVRLVLATHRDLQQRVQEGQFREDLYYRIAVIPIALPPLRQRLDDLPLLIEPLLSRVAQELSLPRKRISPAALDKLRRYRFPGNVRELRNLIERACILARDAIIGPEDFPLDAPPSSAPSAPSAPYTATPAPEFQLPTPSESIDLRQTLDDLELLLIRRALGAAGGVQAEAARRLGLSRSDLAYKVRKFALEDDARRQE